MNDQDRNFQFIIKNIRCFAQEQHFNIRPLKIVICKFIFIALLFMFLHTQSTYAQEIKSFCKCNYLVFIVNSNNSVSTSANMRTFEQFQRSDDACKRINNLCDTRNKGVLDYIGCTNRSLNKQQKEGTSKTVSENPCEDRLNKAEKDFTDQLNQILNKTKDKTSQ